MTRARLMLAAGIALATTAPALAQANPNAPRQPNIQNVPPAWLGYAAMFLLVAAVLAVSLYPSKRSHQD
ncbi:MAG: hypothetical protein FGM37_05815 [Phycisphaerales bacterium]|nr:hypothetical protein [Phycisphaerales bacterium]